MQHIFAQSSNAYMFCDRVRRLELPKVYNVGKQDSTAGACNILKPSMFTLVDMRNRNEPEISSWESLRRLEASETLAKCDAYMARTLHENQNLCPTEWKVEGLHVVFAGTELLTAWGRSFFFLSWNGQAFDLKIGCVTDLLGTLWTAKFLVIQKTLLKEGLRPV